MPPARWATPSLTANAGFGSSSPGDVGAARDSLTPRRLPGAEHLEPDLLLAGVGAVLADDRVPRT